jgi:hypothetical protein
MATISEKLVRINNAKEDIQSALDTPNEKIEEYGDLVSKYVQNQPTSTSTGECDNALDVPCKEFDVLGNSIQDGTPTPDSPVLIQVVKGRNLLDSSTITSQTKNGIVITRNNDGSLTLKGTATATTDIRFAGGWSNTTPIMTMHAGETWRIINTASALTEGQFIVVNGSNHNVLLRSVTNNDDVRTVTQDTSIYDIYLHFDSGAVIDKTIYPMIYIGEATTYLPYNTIEIEQRGKNYLDYTSQYAYKESSSLLNGGTITISGNSVIMDGTNATASMTAKSDSFVFANCLILPKGTYYTNVRINTYKVSDTSKLIQYGEGTFTITEPVYVKQWYVTCAVGNKKTFSPQIESGTTATSYEPYQEPHTYQIPLKENYLAKVGNTRDKLVIGRNGKVKIEHNIEELVLNGSESWFDIKMINVYAYYTLLTNVVAPTTSGGTSYGLCSHYTITAPDKNWKTAVGSNNFTINNSTTSNAYLRFTNGEETDNISTFTTWLSTNKPIVYYQLSTPSEIELDSIEPIELYSGTNIFSMDTGLNTDFEVEYIVNANEKITQLEDTILELGGEI